MNVKITRVLRWITAFEVSVLIISGAGLFFIPEIFSQFWAWELLPFNTRFLGAIYLASMASALSIVIYPYWSLGRVVVPMITVFTAVVFLVSILYLHRFRGPLYATALWFILYFIIPVNGLAHLWFYRGEKIVNGVQLSIELKFLLWIQSLILGVYGITLLIFPEFASSFWTWRLDNFHSQLYSVAFITPAVGSYLLIRSATYKGLITLGITQAIGGVLPIIGTLIVDTTTKNIEWFQLDSILWVGLFGYVIVSGIVMLVATVRNNIPEISDDIVSNLSFPNL